MEGCFLGSFVASVRCMTDEPRNLANLDAWSADELLAASKALLMQADAMMREADRLRSLAESREQSVTSLRLARND